MDDLLQEFLTETNESISTLDVELVNLEQNPDNPELIDNIFRLVHTIKGTCGFLGLPRLESVAHSGENILGKFRDGELTVTPEAVTLILEAMDRIKDLLGELEQTETEPEGEDSELIARLDAFASGKSTTAAGVPAADAPAAEAPAAAAPAVEATEPPAAEAPAAEAAPEPVAEVAPAAAADDGNYDPELGRELKEGEVALSELERIFQETAALEADAAPAAAPEAAAPAEPVAEAKAAAPEPAKPAAKAAEPKAAETSVANQSIRVNVDLLENLMTMISELVLTRNQLLQMVRGMEDSEFTVPLQRLSSITTELQEGVMKTRMQPIGNAWAKLPRIVRDLALELDKKIDLQMYGQDTELDRQVLELIKDPLTHMVRNSADHGMEQPAERTAAGKQETGRITLNAFHEGGHIIIEISDDGHGINVAKVKQKVIDNGLASEAELEGMSDQQIQQYIFRAGFSTAEKVTNVSGRGVGMDVVRTNIEKIGGTIDLRSEEGKGSCFTIKIPLTLAIVSALIVECARERFAVPQLSVVELVRASTKDSDHKIETINDTPVLRLRDRLLPLVHLDRVIGLGGVSSLDDLPAKIGEAADAETEAVADGADAEAAAEDAKPDVIKAEAFIIVTQVGNYQFGIVVDRVFDTEEIVVKPIAPILRDLSIYSGNTILGDGSVIMILDPNGVAATTGEVSVSDTEAEQLAQSMVASDDRTSLLMFRAGNDEPKAVPLSLVARLEEIDVDSIEHANGQYVAQYRGKLMPLVKMSAECKMRDAGRQPVLVFADDDRSMGLVVDEILDIVDESLQVELQAGRDGLLGTAVVAGQATEVIDVAHFLHNAFSDWFSKNEGVGTGGTKRRAKVLLVDDSPFFRNMLVPMLQVAGYEVTTADDPVHALKLRDSGNAFDVIVSDIEMPGMNGFEFAQECKKDGRWQDIPIVALSSHTAPQDLEKGRAVGFTDYIAKSDRDGLLNTLSQTIGFVGDAA